MGPLARATDVDRGASTPASSVLSGHATLRPNQSRYAAAAATWLVDVASGSLRPLSQTLARRSIVGARTGAQIANSCRGFG